MPQNPRFRNNQRKPLPKKPLEVDQQNPVLKAFQGYARELDDKHDRHERIVKLSRDITIESKRIIFLLHTIDGRKDNIGKVLEEAQQRLNKIIEVNFKAVAKELDGQDPYQFRWAYSPGLQEFIEAYTFMEYFKNTTDGKEENITSLSDWNMLHEKMHYEEKMEIKKNEASETEGEKQEAEENCEEAKEETETRKYEFFVDPTEYILGVSDVTGELMRRCINSLGSGETATVAETCKVLQSFYTGYIGLNVQRCRELSRKIFTMRQSVLKAENVCYNVKVRGGEAAKWGAVFDSKQADDVDEGFY